MMRIVGSRQKAEGSSECRSVLVSALRVRGGDAEESRCIKLLPPALCPLPTSRRGVTLIELLITITIIAILGSAILGVASVAMNTAREARTRNLVARLQSLMAEHYDTYKVRRVKLNAGLKQNIESSFSNNSRARGEALAQARLYAMRELMLMEIPDRWSDVALMGNLTGVNPTVPRPPLYFAERPGLSQLYHRQLARMVSTINTVSGTQNTFEDIAANQGAECLYLVIMNACGEGEARGQFRENDTGDTDGDGAPEFLDAWGHPIEFLRWAPGFASDAQMNLYDIGNDPRVWQSKADADHDPFDIFRRDRLAFRLQPLIYSAGSDERYGIERNDDTQVWYTSAVAAISAPLYFRPQLTPYQNGSTTMFTSMPAVYTGTPIDRNGNRDPRAADATDNIHSHLIGTR